MTPRRLATLPQEAPGTDRPARPFAFRRRARAWAAWTVSRAFVALAAPWVLLWALWVALGAPGLPWSRGGRS